jgi:hypothetical protein
MVAEHDRIEAVEAATDGLVDKGAIEAAVKVEDAGLTNGDGLVVVLDHDREAAGSMRQLAREVHRQEADDLSVRSLLPCGGVLHRAERRFPHQIEYVLHCQIDLSFMSASVLSHNHFVNTNMILLFLFIIFFNRICFSEFASPPSF